MGTKEQPASVRKFIVSNKAYELAEQWVNRMYGKAKDEPEEHVQIVPRRPRFGLGAELPSKPQPGPSNDPFERKLQKMFVPGKKKAIGGKESRPSSNNKYAIDDNEEDDELESRTAVFSKKRTTLLSNKLLRNSQHTALGHGKRKDAASKEYGSSLNGKSAIDDDEEEDESESRTAVFSKKRTASLPAAPHTKKKAKSTCHLGK